VASAAPSAESIAKRSFTASGPTAVPDSVQCPCDAGNSHAMHMMCQQPKSRPIMSAFHPRSKRGVRVYCRWPDASAGTK
jgi:hypothetical protein